MQVTFEEFKKLDMRTAKILKVEDHPNADKLYLVTVEIDAQQKTLVAGLKKYYSKEELTGKAVIVMNNLAPAAIRGVESQGMILAASNSTREKLTVLTTDKPIETGCKIS